MKAKDLIKIYPNSKLSKNKSSKDNYYNFFDGNNYVQIKLNELSKQEVLLLDSMQKEKFITSDWYNLLVNGIYSNNITGNQVQIIQFEVKKINDKKTEWLRMFSSLFSNVYDAFFTSAEVGVIILKDFRKSKSELEGYLQMLDDDFSTLTSVYIGSLCDVSNVYKVFTEEKVLFESNKTKGKILTFYDVYIQTYIAKTLKDSVVSESISNILKNDNDLVLLIESLWKNQGNQSAAALELFVHRNTVNYRIDKLYQDHNLNLRNIKELLLAYLLII